MHYSETVPDEYYSIQLTLLGVAFPSVRYFQLLSQLPRHKAPVNYKKGYLAFAKFWGHTCDSSEHETHV